MNCLLDTGTQVSTITESFFRKHLNEHAESIVDVSPYLSISAAQGLEIHYVGYIELPIAFLGHIFSADKGGTEVHTEIVVSRCLVLQCVIDSVRLRAMLMT